MFFYSDVVEVSWLDCNFVFAGFCPLCLLKKICLKTTSLRGSLISSIKLCSAGVRFQLAKSLSESKPLQVGPTDLNITGRDEVSYIFRLQHCSYFLFLINNFFALCCLLGPISLLDVFVLNWRRFKKLFPRARGIIWILCALTFVIARCLFIFPPSPRGLL